MFKYIIISFFILHAFLGMAQNKSSSIPRTASYDAQEQAPSSGVMVTEAKKKVVINLNTKEISVKQEKQTERLKAESVEEKDRRESEVVDIEEELEQNETNLGYRSQNQNAYYTYLTSSQNKRDYSALKQAYQLAPQNVELQFEMSKYYEQSNQSSAKKQMLNNLKSVVSEPLKEYAYNTLMSVEQNAILITYGKNDTYPIWILQELEGKRKDVKVLNYDLLMDDDYRRNKAKELGLKLSKSYTNQLDILKDIATKNTGKSIYYSLTVSHLLMKNLKNNLYTVGLAFKYSNTEISNIATIKTNWEDNFLKTQLKSSVKAGEIRKMEMNYLLPLTQLARHYKEQNNTTAYNEIKETCIAIAKRNGKESEVTEIFKKM